MALTEIEFGQWMPSLPNYKNPGCEVAENVIPTTRGYAPRRSFLATDAVTSGPVRGAKQIFTNDDVSLIVGGTPTALFTRRSGAITETTGYATVGENEAWDFCRFNDFIIATADGNAPQYLTDVDTDDAWVDLPGSPPVAKHCAKVGEFVMLGNVVGAPSRIQWSAYNNPAGSWAVDRLTQAGFADLTSDFGPVQSIVGGRYALVFQARGIQRISYVGPPLVWRADIVSSDRGAVAPFSVVTVGFDTYFLAQDGFYVTNGSATKAIASQRINEWFEDNAAQSGIQNVQGAVDWENECIVWTFQDVTSSVRNRFICYAWSQDRWSSGTIVTDWVVASQVDGISIDALDAIYGNLDAIPISLDAEEFKPRNRRLSAFVNVRQLSDQSSNSAPDFSGESDAASCYGEFSGPPLEAVFETGQFQIEPQRFVFVSEVQPIFDADGWTAFVSLTTVDQRNQYETTPEKETGRNGFAPVRGEGQKMAVRVRMPEGLLWSDAQGVQVRYAPGGFR